MFGSCSFTGQFDLDMPMINAKNPLLLTLQAVTVGFMEQTGMRSEQPQDFSTYMITQERYLNYYYFVNYYFLVTAMTHMLDCIQNKAIFQCTTSTKKINTRDT